MFCANFPFSIWTKLATILALHVLVGAKLLNTLTNSAACTIIFSVVTAFACFFVSLPRTLNQLSGLGVFSAATMGIAVLLAVVFSGIQDHPFGYIMGQEPIVTMMPIRGTTYVSGMYSLFYKHRLLELPKGMSAFLNITYTLVGQITLPSVGCLIILDILAADFPRISSSLR